jgi:hypothetical protein
MFCMDRRTNSNYFPAQHCLPGAVSVFQRRAVYHRVGSCQSLTNRHFAWRAAPSVAALVSGFNWLNTCRGEMGCVCCALLTSFEVIKRAGIVMLCILCVTCCMSVWRWRFSVNLPIVLYGCETWSVTIRKDHSLKVDRNTILWKLFGSKREEVTGKWRMLLIAEGHALQSSPSIIRIVQARRMKWVGHAARMGKTINAYGV